MSEVKFDISAPIEEILEAKINFHKSQIEVHQIEIEKLRAYSKRPIDIFSKEAKQPPKNDSANRDFKYGKKSVLGFDITQKNIKPFVLKILQKSKGVRFKTSDLFEILQNEYNIPDEERRNWVIAISLSLHSLVKYDKNVRQLETDDGRIKEYLYRNTALPNLLDEAGFGTMEDHDLI